MKKIIPIIFFLVFAVIGVGMLIGSFSILNMETSAMDGAEEITAYITDIQTHEQYKSMMNIFFQSQLMSYCTNCSLKHM